MSQQRVSGACLRGTVWECVAGECLRNVSTDLDFAACLEKLVELVLDGNIFWDLSATLVLIFAFSFVV